MTAKLKPAKFSSFARGMNTRKPDYKLKASTPPFGTFMREIVNCDISSEGALKLRAGYALVQGGSVVTGIWADDSQAYYVDGAAMYQISAPVSQSALVRTVVSGAAPTSGNPASFETAPMGGAYWTDGIQNGYIVAGVSTPLAPPQPTVLPVVTQGTGSLDVGLYTYVFSYINAAGLEGPATAPVQLSVAQGGSLIFTLAAIPTYNLKVSVSQPNGKECYRMLSFNLANGAQSVTSMATQGEPCMTMGLQPLPPGRFIRYNNGRLMVASGSILYYSKPFMPGLYDPTMDFIPFSMPITVCEVVSNEGVFVVSDQTYWLGGDVADVEKLVSKLQYGAVMGSGMTRPDINGCFWMSDRGIVVGNDGGDVTPLQEDNVSIKLTATGASLMMDHYGVVELLTCLSGATISPEAKESRYTSSEVIDPASSTSEAWVVGEAAVTSRRYVNYPFTGFCEINGHYYGITLAGIYLLEGTTDAGTAILASITPGRQDFGSPMRKRMDSAYITVSTVPNPAILGNTGTMHLTITDDQGNVNTYDTRRNDPTMQQQRFDVGKGIQGNWLNFLITNDTGCAFELNGFELNVAETARRLHG